MATSWGPINGHLRVGIDVRTTTNGTTTTVYWDVYVQAVAWGFADPQTITLSGAVSATKNYTMNSPSGGTSTVKVGTWTTVVNQSDAAQSKTITAKVSGAYNGAAPSYSRSVSVKAQKQNPPSPPTSVTAARNSDTTATVSWVEPANANSPGTLWYFYNVQKLSGDSTTWVAGNSQEDDMTSWVDSSLSTNMKYQYRVRGENDGGVSAWVNSNFVYTTPKDPSNLTAQLTGNGVRLNWQSNSPYATSWIVYDNGVPLNQNVSGKDLTLSSPTVLHHADGRYNSFPYMARNSTTKLAVWRDAARHYSDVDTSTIRFKSSNLNSDTYSAAWVWEPVSAKGGGADDIPQNTAASPVGLAWDEVSKQWIMLLHWATSVAGSVTQISARWNTVVASPDGKTWTKIAELPKANSNWFFGNEIRIYDSLWIAAGYGSLKTGYRTSNWSPSLVVSQDSGATWQEVGAPANLPSGLDFAEPRIFKISDSSWYMLIRTDTGTSNLHSATSTDGINWTYSGIAIPSATGNPVMEMTSSGVMVNIFRNPNNTLANRPDGMGAMGWAYSTDQGKTWIKRVDSFDTADRYVYAGMVRDDLGNIRVVYAVEDDPTNKLNPMAATVYSGTIIQPVTGTPITDISGTGYLISGSNTVIPHTYEVRAVAGTIPSTGTAKVGPITLSAAPAKPQVLIPNSNTPQESGLITRLSWDHVSVDTSLQTKFEVRYRRQGSTSWTSPGAVSSTQSFYDIPGGPQALGSTWEWQVRTWGTYTDPSPWSDLATYSIHAAPVVTITEPREEIEHLTGDGKLHATWTYSSPEGAGAADFLIYLEDVTELQVDLLSASGAARTYLSPGLHDGYIYTLTVIGTDVNGMTSAPARVSFPIRFLPPGTPLITADWEAAGFVDVKVTPDNSTAHAETTSVDLYRSVNGGDWELLTTMNQDSFEFYDVTAPMAGSIAYRAVAHSALGSTAEARADLAADVFEDGCGVWISGGPNYMQLVYLRVPSKLDLTTGRDRTLNTYAGRSYPVETSHGTLSKEVAVSAKFLPEEECPDELLTAHRERVEALFDLPGPHLFRDAYGRWMYCELSKAEISYAYLGEVSFTATKVDPGTAEQLSAISAYEVPRLVELVSGEYAIIGGEESQVNVGEWTWEDKGTN